MKAVSRLLDCLSDPGDTEWIAPLVMDEILIRILRSPFGKQVAEMGFVDSGVQRVAKAIAWLRSNFSQQMKVTDLADLMHMSVSSFNEHFKSVTSMSPLQYQKALRLHEARRLMFSDSRNASTAARQVGYISISQFSRDYSRFLEFRQAEISPDGGSKNKFLTTEAPNGIEHFIGDVDSLRISLLPAATRRAGVILPAVNRDYPIFQRIRQKAARNRQTSQVRLNYNRRIALLLTLWEE